MDSLTVQQVADKWGVTPRWVQALMKHGSIPGVIHFGRAQMAPRNGPKNNRRPRKESETE